MADNNYKEYTFNIPKRDGVDLMSLAGGASLVYVGVDNTTDFHFNPYISGYSFIKWIQLPPWFEQDPYLKYFAPMTEKNFRSFNGLGSIELQTASYQSGFAGRDIDVITGVNHMNNDFSISHIEWSGGLMRKLYERWLFNVRDPLTGVCLYPKKYGYEESAQNHTAQLLYINCKPSVTSVDGTPDISKSTIEFACWYTNVFPLQIDYSHMNYNVGEQNQATLEIPFKGLAHVGDRVLAYAYKVLSEQVIRLPGNNGTIPFIDENYSSDEHNDLLTKNDPFSEIYNPKE